MVSFQISLHSRGHSETSFFKSVNNLHPCFFQCLLLFTMFSDLHYFTVVTAGQCSPSVHLLNNCTIIRDMLFLRFKCSSERFLCMGAVHGQTSKQVGANPFLIHWQTDIDWLAVRETWMSEGSSANCGSQNSLISCPTWNLNVFFNIYIYIFFQLGGQ